MFKLTVFVLLSMLLLGCGKMSAKMNSASDPFEPVFIISWNKFMKTGPADVGEVKLAKKVNNQWETIWLLRHETPGTYPKIREIKYGKANSGLIEIIPAQKLEEGNVYLFVVSVSEIASSVEFVIKNDNGKNGIHVLSESP